MNISKKNIIFIILGIIVLIGAVVFAVLVNIKKTSETEQKTNGGTDQNIPVLPETQISPSPDLSAVKRNTQEELVNVQNTRNQISEKIYKDPAGITIGLDDFAKANEIKIESEVIQSASQKDYVSFSCANTKNNQPAVGLMLQLRRDVDPEKYRQLYSKMEKDMKNWEKAIFQDLAPLFFPGESFSKEPIFGDAKYSTSNKANIVPIRFANLVAASGQQYSIDWGFLNDQIFISNDKDCLRRELDKNADAYEP